MQIERAVGWLSQHLIDAELLAIDMSLRGQLRPLGDRVRWQTTP